MGLISSFLSRFRAPAPPIDDTLWRQALDRVPLAKALDEPRRHYLRRLAGDFLHTKRFQAMGGAELDDFWRLAIAMQASLPALPRGPAAFKGWTNVLVYPGEFNVRRSHYDAHSGVVTDSDDTLIGEAWDRGPMVLSLADVALDLEAPWDGFNVVVHEMAHKLDMLAGPASGVPPLPKSMNRREWIQTMQAAFDKLVKAVERGRHTIIDPYAAEAPEEFFAVTSEMHFSKPAALREAEPKVAKLLDDFYGPSPTS
ncbi:zinc-dependent peptidase [Luteibacter aegosomatis]|uniref:M90 family metallopeptidase n=1 Tax=Luteibacter aegosomatis TaxID=2911537 RepID=UPI001FFA8108|nr:M90 family metallopeptidase [Luteibacter aegosomatis]UPG86479.1 zinc-dependent peptidase [Luteibacter aegosomatis]